MPPPEGSGNNKAKKQTVTIREMEIDDVATVFHLGEQLFTASRVPNLYRTWDEFEVVSLFQTDTEYCLVAEVDDKVVGFALGTIIQKSKSSWSYGYLLWLGVDPACQKLGVASKLFRQFHNLMAEDGARILMIDTESDNMAAIHFFKKMGFSDEQEHIFMAKNIDAKRKQYERRHLKEAAKANGYAGKEEDTED